MLKIEFTSAQTLGRPVSPFPARVTKTDTGQLFVIPLWMLWHPMVYRLFMRVLRHRVEIWKCQFVMDGRTDKPSARRWLKYYRNYSENCNFHQVTVSGKTILPNTHWQLSKIIWRNCDCNGLVSFFMQKTFVSFIAGVCHNKYFGLH